MIRILWADDQIDVTKSFSTVLAPTGALIDFCADGEQALDKASKQQYDLILTDLAMPPGHWGGLWLLEQLKARGIQTAVIVVSGEGSQSETIQALRLGAIDYVTKEQLSNELPQQIISALEAKSSALDDNKLASLTGEGECETREFKSTLRLNLHTKNSDKNIELSALKTIAAFLNSSGGTLLIGVSDNGNVVGIEKDGFKNIDKFQLHFWNLAREFIGTEFCEVIKTSVHKFKSGTVFSISCTPSTRPVFISWKAPGESTSQDLFFVRAGPQTESLSTRQALEYIKNHFN